MRGDPRRRSRPSAPPPPPRQRGATAADPSMRRSSRGRRRISPTGEVRLALLDERGEPLLRVLAREEAAELRVLALEVRYVLALQSVVQRALRGGERERALRGEQARSLERLVEHRILYAVDEAARKRLVGLDEPPGEDQLLREAEAAQPRQPLRAAPARDDPEVDLRLAELRARGRVADIARRRELAAAAESEAVDRRDGRLGHAFQEIRNLVSEDPPLRGSLGVHGAHGLDVGARDEGAVSGSGEDDRSDLVVVA